MGFTGIPDKHAVHSGYKMNTATSNKLMKNDETKAYYGEFPADLCAGKHLIFIYTNIIEYQYVGEAKAPLLRVIDSKQRTETGQFVPFSGTGKVILTLQFKKFGD